MFPVTVSPISEKVAFFFAFDPIQVFDPVHGLGKPRRCNKFYRVAHSIFIFLPEAILFWVSLSAPNQSTLLKLQREHSL